MGFADTDRAESDGSQVLGCEERHSTNGRAVDRIQADPVVDDELIVLLSDDGRTIGTAPKLASHHRETPLHSAFSSYVFDGEGRFLLTRRALSKKTWPGVWTNSCCGHPAPGEDAVSAVRRRLNHELGLSVTAEEIVPLLPDFRYRAELDGIVENEICPVFGVRVDAEPVPNPDEVEEYRWVDWPTFVTEGLAGRSEVGLSPWALLQLAQLEDHPVVAALRKPSPSGEAPR
ncbi:isopentenyl-diphosphate delta-isomerase [Cryptosporangium arvum DSM 44712]|uniref:Isopentenyl-diphosphate Delta-isomerase n=1 Tax=Cryptosporangium arvum DSM 44712 TaxID=927661 RepID=A0A010YGC9_9ACTN|nr:isopentenyl-diphosphate delta-isomerase [Cryptosporangium arvum DSM 44712]